ncbi:TniQ family protein [Streptomyces sp. NPDC004675]|uniref:TniQ family protein n=1 Tax=Streptomyces sp. NPDC004675 TaxID=3154286 RepID=UPI0033A8E931
MRFFAGESTGSYVTRLAARNGLSVERLLESVGDGLSAAKVDPRYTELYVDRAGRDQLAALTGRSVADLVRALPSLEDEHLLPSQGGGPVWKWPWEPHGGYLVRGCALCAAGRDINTPIWMMCPDMWHICVRHGRFTDNSRDDRIPFIDLAPGPHVVSAEQQRLQLVHRLGATGRALMADAFGVLAYEAPDRLRLGGRRTAPLGLLPAAVRLASAMASMERRRLEFQLSTADYRRWLEQTRASSGGRFRIALHTWTTRHRLLEGAPAAPAGRRRRLPLNVPHEEVGSMQSVDEIACVPWPVLGSGEHPYG